MILAGRHILGQFQIIAPTNHSFLGLHFAVAMILVLVNQKAFLAYDSFEASTALVVFLGAGETQLKRGFG